MKCVVCNQQINGSYMESEWCGEKMCMDCMLEELDYSETYEAYIDIEKTKWQFKRDVGI